MGFPGLLTSSDRPSSSWSLRSKSSIDSSDHQLIGTPTGGGGGGNSSNSGGVHHAGSHLPEFIHDEAQLPCLPPRRPDLQDLNNCLEALAAVFPDVQIEVFRELLGSFDGESRLALVADGLLKNRAAWVKGRWRLIDNGQRGAAVADAIPRGESFRSKEYKKAVSSLAWSEFRGLSRSTITAVLAESNHSYLDARPTLATLSSKSWRFTISSLFLRRRPITKGEAENHPLVIWRSSGQGSIYPAIRATGDAELDRELFDTLIRPLKERDREMRATKDRGLAVLLNNEEAEEANAMHECTCCFTSYAFEDFTTCNTDGHMLCFRCVQLSLSEALFGQGWQSSINPEKSGLRCLAVESSGCAGHVSADHIRRAMSNHPTGAELLRKLDQRLAEHSLLASNQPLVRCPFCDYAEIDDVYVSPSENYLRLRTDNYHNLVVLLLAFAILPLLVPVTLFSFALCLLIGSNQTLHNLLSTECSKALSRHRRRRRGLRFSCQNPLCSRSSCLFCQKAWADIHVCHESSLVALRTQVEQAMSMAIKRVCPRCATSFVKNAGCNKLTCPCGYKMCYVCRADLGDEGYRHFCDHFRPDGDPRPCKECARCNLWESEDTERVLQQAREEAERQWKEAEQRELSETDKSFLKTGVATQRKANGVTLDKVFGRRQLFTVPELFDIFIETIFV